MDVSKDASRISVSINAELVQWIDELTDDRTAAVEAAIQFWCEEQTRYQRQRGAELRRQKQDEDEAGWLV